MNDISARGQKAVDVASTYIEVLIGLASGIITAVLAFYPSILTIQTLNFYFLKVSLVFFGSSIGAGIVGLGGLVYATSDFAVAVPPTRLGVMIPVGFQFALFGLGIAILLYVIP